MKYVSSLLLASQLMMSTVSLASPEDIKGTRYALKSAHDQNGNVSFLFCDNKKVPEACEYIGRNSGYSPSELEAIKRSEVIEARLKTGGVVVLGILGAFTGAAVGLVASGASASVTGAVAVGQTAEIIVVAGAGATAPLWFEKMNPWHQFAQAEVLNEEGLMTKKIVTKSDQEVIDVANLLSEILN